MQPISFLDQAQQPLFDALFRYSKLNELIPDKVLEGQSDLRELIKLILDALHSSKSIGNTQVQRRNLRMRRMLEWTLEIYNIRAHDLGYNREMFAIHLASLCPYLLEEVGQKKSKEFEAIQNYKELLFEKVFSEYAGEKQSVDPESDGLRDSIISGIDSLHEKIDRVIAHNRRSNISNRKSFAALLSKRQKLESIREQIESLAAERGVSMAGFQHLLQWNKLDELIDDQPSDKDQLRGWARRKLKSYLRNQKYIDRQIERWGDDIVEAIK